MVGSSPSDGANGRCGNGWIKFRRFRVQEGTEIPRPSFKNAYIVLSQHAILVHDELFACRLSTVQPHRARQVLVEAPLVVVSETSLGFSKVFFEVGM